MAVLLCIQRFENLIDFEEKGIFEKQKKGPQGKPSIPPGAYILDPSGKSIS